MDKDGKVLFTNRIANMGGEPGAFNYESWAHWKSIDTITVTSIRKFTRGFLMPADWKGLDTDTLIQEIVITPAGSIDSKLTDSVFHSRKFLDTSDWSYR